MTVKSLGKMHRRYKHIMGGNLPGIIHKKHLEEKMKEDLKRDQVLKESSKSRQVETMRERNVFCCGNRQRKTYLGR